MAESEAAQSLREPLVRFDLVSIFPQMLDSVFRSGVVARGLEAKIAAVHTTDLRDFTHDRHRTVDDRPYGGGEGMVLKPDPLFAAVESLGVAPKPERDTARESVILLSAQGERFTQRTAQERVAHEDRRAGRRVVLLCGRYEGVDKRVVEHLCDREISIGDYVLSGGELGAAVIVDSVVRLLPGVLGNADSARYESFGGSAGVEALDTGVPTSVAFANGLLDYPHYTRPAEFRGCPVPEVLLGGDHAAIRLWRREQALRKTLRHRPDLLFESELSAEDRRILERIKRDGRSAESPD